MTNFIQMVPSTTPSTQYFAHGAINPLFVPNETQANATQATPAATPALTLPTPTSTAPVGLGEGLFFQRHSSGPNPATPQVPCAGVTPLDSQLPQRPTCPMPYHPDVGISRVEHSKNAGCKFYIACPARIQGTYNTSQRADEQVKGYRNGRAIAVHNWADAEAKWVTACLRWHGPICPNARPPVTMNTRVQLNPALREEAPAKQWVVKGVPGYSISRRVFLNLSLTPDSNAFLFRRELAFAAAAERDLHEIHILGSTDEARLRAWAN
ncbi:hypothetical protein K438DRAFT_1773035 [Mycena galopus ATCC 62051]|nr:hypothetical protein K438DRAFT_1773035 [Mycena galopus ATCC 62051]